MGEGREFRLEIVIDEVSFWETTLATMRVGDCTVVGYLL